MFEENGNIFTGSSMPVILNKGSEMRNILMLFFVLFCAGIIQAELIIHLDATVPGSVSTNGSGVVDEWADQSGNHNHAVDNVGNVYYPGSSLSQSGLAGLDFGTGRNDLELLNGSETSALLDFSGAASGNEGFSVLVAFKVDEMPGVEQHVIGTRHTLGYFAIKVDSDGTIKLKLNNNRNASGNAKVVAGDTVVVGMTYEAATGNYQLWESKNNEISSGDQNVNADYGKGNILRLGEANVKSRSNEYLRGMVGEVKIYNHVLSSQGFKYERELLAEKWANIPRPISINWRVIPDDPCFPTEDTILAAISIGDSGFGNPLPADPANGDCTATFQEALNVVSMAGGGTVFVPEGQYRLDGTLTIGDNVTLRGRWREITASQPAAGTIIKIYADHGNAAGTALITALGGGGVKDMTFWHPLQDPASIIPYPYVLASRGGTVSFDNITFINAYQGVDMSKSSMCFVSNVQGTVLQYGFYADQSAAISRFENLNFGPEFWEWADLPDAAPVGTAYQTHMLSNATGVDMREMDGFHLSNCRVRGMKTGVLFAPSPLDGQTPNGGFVSGLDIRDCVVAFDLNDTGTTLLNSVLYGTDKAVRNDGSITLNSCTLTGGNTAIDSSSDNSLTATMTTFDGVINQSGGKIQLVACDFQNTGNDVLLGNFVDSVHIAGCTFADGPDLIDNSPASIVKIIDHHPVYGYAATPQLPPRDLSFVRKPNATTLFDMTDFGAIADDGSDDSAALGAAIGAANANGGGIVFVPDGTFDVAGSYTLSSGVELRGTSGSINGASGKSGREIGSLLQITGHEGNLDGPAFLELNSGCGVRGLSFHYPNQREDMLVPETIIAYPFTIRGTGENIYITDTFMSNPYQAIHFYQADNHLLEKCKLGGLNKTILVEECNNGRIGKFHLKPDFWRDIWLGDYPPTGEGTSKLKSYCGKYLTGIWLKNSTSEVVHSIFNHASHLFMRVDNSTGLGYKIGGEQLQGGYRFSGDRDFSLVFPNCNINNIGDYTGLWGIWTDDAFTGTLSIWNGSIPGTPGRMFHVQSGTLDVQQVHNPGWSKRGNVSIQVDGGAILKFKMAQIGRYFAPVFAADSVVSILDSQLTSYHLPNAMLYDPAVLTARNVYSKTYVSTSANAGDIVDNGMVLDPANLIIEDSPIMEGEAYDARRVSGARTTDGDYTIDVMDADFTNGASRSLNIETYFRVDADCAIAVYYDSTSGKKLGKSQTYNGLTLPGYERVNFSVNDAQFDGADDIVIEITGDSPLLNSVTVLRDVSPVIKLLPDLTNDGFVDFEDFTEISRAWLMIYGPETLATIAENWLFD